MPPVNRRRALTALAVGVVAPGALAACVSRSGKASGEATAPPAPSLTFEPAQAATDVSPTAKAGLEVKDGWFQKVALTNPQGKVATINPDTQVNGQFQLADGQVVGVAAPIIIQFDASISDKASVEKALK